MKQVYMRLCDSLDELERSVVIEGSDDDVDKDIEDFSKLGYKVAATFTRGKQNETKISTQRQIP